MYVLQPPATQCHTRIPSTLTHLVKDRDEDMSSTCPSAEWISWRNALVWSEGRSFCRDLYDRLLLYFCPLCAALLLKASNRHQYGPRLLRSHRAAAGFSTRSKPELCALDWMLLTPHIVIVKSVCVDVGPVVCFPGAVVPLFLWRRDSSGVWPFTDARTAPGTVLMFTALSHVIYGYIRDGPICVCVGLLLTITFVA